jgi:hypothetical protein
LRRLRLWPPGIKNLIVGTWILDFLGFLDFDSWDFCKWKTKKRSKF